LQDSNEIVQVVTINGANVVQAQLLKESRSRARDHATSVLINLGCGFLQHASMMSLQQRPESALFTEQEQQPERQQNTFPVQQFGDAKAHDCSTGHRIA